MASKTQERIAIVALVVIILGVVGYIGYAVFTRLNDTSAEIRPKAAPLPEVPEPPHVIVAHWDADTSTDVNAIEEYQRAAGEALLQGKYDELEDIAKEDRAKKLRFSGGTWKLLELYRGLTNPVQGDEGKDADWQAML